MRQLGRSYISFVVVALLAFVVGSFTSFGPAVAQGVASVVLRLIAGPPITETLQVVKSQDRRSSVSVIRVNAGGATVDFDYEVLLRRSDSAKKARLWRSYGLRPTNVKWIASDVVEITIPSPTVGELPHIERWPQEGVLVIERLSL